MLFLPPQFFQRLKVHFGRLDIRAEKLIERNHCSSFSLKVFGANKWNYLVKSFPVCDIVIIFAKSNRLTPVFTNRPVMIKPFGIINCINSDSATIIHYLNE